MKFKALVLSVFFVFVYIIYFIASVSYFESTHLINWSLCISTFFCHACIYSHFISYLKSVMCHIFSYQQSNSLRSSFTSWWSFFMFLFWLCWCSRNNCVDFAGPLWMQCLCYCIHAVQAKMLIYLNEQEYWWKMDEIKCLCLHIRKKWVPVASH